MRVPFASQYSAKRSFEDKCVPNCNLGTRKEFALRAKLATVSDFVRIFVVPLFLFLALLLAPLRAENPKADQKITVPPLSYKHSNLPNGLQIYTVEDHKSPTVAVQVWYHVGSKDDPNGRSGFAHLFEHMMFKGNEHLTEQTFDDLTENIGGENNAFTADDVTVTTR